MAAWGVLPAIRAVLAALRDDLIARHGFQEVPPELRTRAQVFLDHLSHMKVRTWA